MDEGTAEYSFCLSSMEKSKGTDNVGSKSVSHCRLCVSSNERMVPIFSEHGKELQLAYKINKLLPIMITPLDRLPQEVCFTCIKELDSACEFVNKCLVSQAKLRNVLKINQTDDNIPIQVVHDYSTHWSVGNGFKKMGNSGELHLKRLRKLLMNSERESSEEEERNGQMKKMKLLHDGDDDGSGVVYGSGNSNKSVNCADEINADIPSYNMDTGDDDTSADRNAVREENTAVARESNTCVSKSISDERSVVDEFGIAKSINYLCKFCGKGFYWKAELFGHQLVEHSDLVIRCGYCLKVFYDKDELESHELAHEKLFPPGVAVKKQVEDSVLKNRKNDSLIEQSLANCIARITSSNCADISRSADSHESDRTCYYCNLVFPTLKLHRRHVRRRHPLKFPCRFCPVTSISIYHHRKHEKIHKRDAMKCKCKKVFYYANDVRDHRLIHMHKNERKCEVCGDTFTCDESLEEHIKTHDGESNYLCEACGESFGTFFLFRVHKLSHLYPGIQRCELCDFCFHGMDELDTHMVFVHNRRRICCFTCGESFISMEQMRKHRDEQNCTSVSCNECGKEFNSLRKMRIHAEGHYPEKNYLCDKCGKGFKLKKNLWTHLQHESCLPTFVTCDVCGRKLGSQVRLNIHMRIHRGEKHHLCAVCGKSFHSTLALYQHTVTHRVPKIPCPICGMLFVRKQYMLLHKKRHRATCNTCGQVFENTPLLEKHQKIHVERGESSPTESKAHECDVCGKGFINSHGLKNHIPVHSNERPFKCNLCDKQYRRAKDLAKHTDKKHGNPKPYHCHFCPCSFVTKKMMLKHENGHTVGKAYNCESCGLGFWSAVNYEKHVMKHTNSKSPGKYLCKHCGKSFPLKSSLLTHETIHFTFKCSFCPRKFQRMRDLRKHKCPYDPCRQRPSTSIQGSTFIGDISPMTLPTILTDGSVLQHVQPKVSGERVNINAELKDYNRHFRTLTNSRDEEINNSKISVQSSDEEEYMGPQHPHLRHPHSSKTVQLVSDIPVFIRKRMYEGLVIRSISSTALARNLVDEVFTVEALRTCSVKGQRQNTRNPFGRREPLCPLGTSAIIAFVQKTNDSFGRLPIKSADIVMAMGHRLSEIRRSHFTPSMNVETENAVIEIQIY